MLMSDKKVHNKRLTLKLFKEALVYFDLAYTSVLKRAIKTTNLALEKLLTNYGFQLKKWRLNERHYTVV